MNKIYKMNSEFIKNGGVLKTSELKDIGISSRQINKLMEEGMISRIKKGFYESTEDPPKEEVIIARLFPKAVFFLESTFMYYGYTDRIPLAWQIAVDKHSKITQYDIDYPIIETYYLEPKYINIGVDIIQVDGVDIRIYDRDRTICDALRYEKKLEREVFINAIKYYLKDPKKNARRLFEYAVEFNITNKVQTYVGIWL
ncbi:MAG: hypothetical protein GX321_01285 [Clostridiales bacterium]|nr:hypothetical protein [Clostridiales bacterium]